MTTNMHAFQALLGGMRDEFLAELPERCDSFEKLILILEKSPTIARPSMPCTGVSTA